MSKYAKWLRTPHNVMSPEAAVIAELVNALRPFAQAFPEWEGIGAEGLTLRQMHAHTPGEVDVFAVTYGHLKRAAEVLK